MAAVAVKLLGDGGPMTASGSGAQRRRRWWLAAIAGSALVHGSLLAALLTRTGAPPPPAAAAIEVTLLRPDLSRREAAPQAQAPAQPPAPDRRPPAISERPATAAPPLARAPGAVAPLQSGPQAPPPPPVPPAPGGPPRAADPLAAVRSALNAGGCLGDRSRLTAAQREACDARLAEGRNGSPAPFSGAHAEALRGLAARRQRPRDLFDALPKSPTCIAGGPCQAELKGVAFGAPPPVLPVIPPSTLRGDDDALRRRPKP